MPSEYKLKNPVLDFNRLQKICKQIMDDSKEDRNLALEAHRYFRQMVEENPQDASAKNLMVDCLKLAQSSKTNTIKAVDLLVKLEDAFKKGQPTSTNNIFDELDKIS
jgi:histone H3/H4